MIKYETSSAIIVNPWAKTREKLLHNLGWLGASRTNTPLPDLVPPTQSITAHKNVDKWRVTANKWTNEVMGKIVLPILSLSLFSQVYAALTTTTLGSNFEIHSAPDVPIALTIAGLGILSGFVAVAAHKSAQSWRAIETWMTHNNLDQINLFHPPVYRDTHW
ncbi:MAG: hypothetical protein UX62_C0012G0002 [Microgenomates group bacterium GW2011_GWA2_46_7]|nr:MAG: hypothetical protein UX62_C0012G0002 [Microgenomates group bacterium GW2011_GWA2_46_7]